MKSGFNGPLTSVIVPFLMPDSESNRVEMALTALPASIKNALTLRPCI